MVDAWLRRSSPDFSLGVSLTVREEYPLLVGRLLVSPVIPHPLFSMVKL